MTEVVSAIGAAAPASVGAITIDGPALPFPGDLDATAFQRDVADIAWTPLYEGVRSTIERFGALLADGTLARPA